MSYYYHKSYNTKQSNTMKFIFQDAMKFSELAYSYILHNQTALLHIENLLTLKVPWLYQKVHVQDTYFIMKLDYFVVAMG